MRSSVVRLLIVTVAVLVGIVVGLVTGVLMYSAGKSWQMAVRDGGIAFGGTVTLVLAVMAAADLL
jgi:hypothetical protein